MSDNKVKFGVLSTARIALKVIPAIQQSSLTECTLIVSRDLKRGEEFAAKVGVPNFSTFENVLQSDVNAFYIPLPSGVRNEWIIKAAQAGKHVYAEKPFSGSFNEVKSMIEVIYDLSHVLYIEGIRDYYCRFIYYFRLLI